MNAANHKSPPVLLILFIVFFTFPLTILAHRLDEFLQATIVVLQPERIRLQINLTPGVAVAEPVLAFIDRNHDGVISTNEAANYCEVLKRDFIVRLDEQNLDWKVTQSNFPEPAELRTGWGIIQIELSAMPGFLSAGSHKLTLENRHFPNASVYLLNAAPPGSASLQISKQIRNENQSTAQIQFAFRPLNSSPAPRITVLFLTLLVLAFFGIYHRRVAITVDRIPKVPRGAHAPSRAAIGALAKRFL